MFSLTQQERQVILFLVCAALVGMGVNFFLKKYSHIKAISVFYQDIGKIDINRADKNLLMSVPGIGEKLGQRIIEYRNKQEGFHTIEELKNIRGITEYRYEKIKDVFVVKFQE